MTAVTIAKKTAIENNWPSEFRNRLRFVREPSIYNRGAIIHNINISGSNE
ncbi:hypothetical protein NBRC111893_284 [Lentilactobacillus kosonis]|uniref:Uncharacterized protein n=1 Tax=Lentilactobacillus kosonis TaxID=2810561 RepID=A0A401FIL2_9LACO|nr:hypothetical protein NBRC111893_284 [Lentilactobacillus kosonis]